MHKKGSVKIILLLFVSFSIISTLNLISQDKIETKRKSRNHAITNDFGNPSESIIDLSNITTWVGDNGFHDWKLGHGLWNGSFPNGADAGVIFTEGIVWGGLVYDGGPQKVRVNGNTYGSGCKAITRLFRVRPDYKSCDLRLDAANYFLKPLKYVTEEDTKQLREQYEKDWNNWPANEGAVYEDVNGDGQYEPTIDIPGVPGAFQTIFIKYDDSKSKDLYKSDPIGLEVSETYWAYGYTGALGNAVFKKVQIVYKGINGTPKNSHIDSMYINEWSDVNLGLGTDDLAGCDTVLNLGYVYNSSDVDKYYNSLDMAPPAAGFDFLQGVSKYTGNPDDSAIFNLKWRKGYKYVNKTPMSTFIRSATGDFFTDPSFSYIGTLEYYNYLRGKIPEPRYPVGLNFPKTVAITTPRGVYFMPGDPVKGTGLIDGVTDGPGARRIWIVSGPFTMNLNDTAETVIALVGGQGTSHLNSITQLKNNDRKIQKYFDGGLSKLPIIKPPAVKVISLHNKIVLNWGTNQDSINAVEKFSKENYNFEGYEVYQLPTKTAGIKKGIKIGSYDLADDITAVYDTVLDINRVKIPKLQIEGKDNGITRYLEITRDTLQQSNLFDGQTYYFAVVAYAYNKSPILPFHIIRSPIFVIEAVPQTHVPGIRYSATFGDTLISRHNGNSEGSVIPIVIDPTSTDGKTYQITFDTVSNSVVWNVKEKLTGKIMISGQSNQSGDNNYPIVNGIMPKVINPPKGIESWKSSRQRWVSGFNWGGSLFYGGMDNGTKFWKNALPFYNYVPIKLKFTGGSGKAIPSKKNGWSQGAVYRKDKSYAYSGVGWMPFTAWDVSDTSNPRQVNVSFVEDSVYGSANLKWDMGWNGISFKSFGGFEYIIVSNTSYNPVFYNDKNNALKNDNMYFIWPSEKNYYTPYLNAPFTLTIIPHLLNKPGDVFEFTAPIVKKSEDLLASDLDKINVFPNPYYTYEFNPQGKNVGFVTFNHLPDNADIKIFDLSGVLVKTIQHTSTDGQFAKWYLKNTYGSKVVSGIYIVYIDMPKVHKTKILKLAIVQ